MSLTPTQDFLSALEEFTAIRQDTICRIPVEREFAPHRRQQLEQAWWRVLQEFRVLSRSWRRTKDCAVGEAMNNDFLVKLDRYRTAYTFVPPNDGMVAALYQDCLAARRAFVDHAMRHKCVS